MSLRGDGAPEDCGSHIDCAWGCPGCPRASTRNGYVVCPKCRERAAFKDFDGALLCKMCRERFHEDFEGFVKKKREVPDPPATGK